MTDPGVVSPGPTLEEGIPFALTPPLHTALVSLIRMGIKESGVAFQDRGGDGDSGSVVIVSLLEPTR